MTPETILAEWLAALPTGSGRGISMQDGRAGFVDVGGEFSLGITVNAQTRTLGFVAFLLPAPEPSQGAVLQALLTLNLSLLALRGACVGIDTESGMLVMGRTAPMDGLDAAGFAALLSQTAEMAQGIRESTQDLLRRSPRDAAASPAQEEEASNWLRL